MKKNLILIRFIKIFFTQTSKIEMYRKIAIIISSIFLITSSIGVYGNTKSKKGLVLETDLIKREYINQNQLRLHLRLNYKNQSDSDVLIYKYSSAVTESWVTKNCNMENCEVIENLLYNSDIYFDDLNNILTKEDFVNLSPSESYEIDTTISLFVGDKAGSKILKDEDYQVKIMVKTLYGKPKEYNRIKKAFFRNSTLWTSNIISSLMSFRT